MSNTRYKVFINDNHMYLFDRKKNNIYEKEFKYLERNEITDEHRFYFELNQFIRKQKIKIPIFGHKIEMIINDNLNLVQQNKFKEFFEDYFQKIKFINITEVLPLDKNTMVINITNKYLDFYYLRKNEKQIIRVDKIIFNNNEFKAISHILNTLLKPKTIILFGTNNIIPQLTEKINKELRTECKFQEDYAKYLIKEENTTK